MKVSELKVGDRVYAGCRNPGDTASVSWLKLDNENHFITEHILAAGVFSKPTMAFERGNPDYSKSLIRSWLNSNDLSFKDHPVSGMAQGALNKFEEYEMAQLEPVNEMGDLMRLPDINEITEINPETGEVNNRFALFDVNPQASRGYLKGSVVGNYKYMTSTPAPDGVHLYTILSSAEWSTIFSPKNSCYVRPIIKLKPETELDENNRIKDTSIPISNEDLISLLFK